MQQLGGKYRTNSPYRGIDLPGARIDSLHGGTTGATRGTGWMEDWVLG